MFRMGKYLEVNRSLNGGGDASRWYQLPRSTGARVISFMMRSRMTNEFIRDAKSTPRVGASCSQRAGGGILF